MVLNMNSVEACIAYVTVKDKKEGIFLAELALKKQLAACANIIPKILSIYLWNGKMQNDKECLLIIKTTKKKFPNLQKLIINSHSYDIPCVLSLSVSGGNPKFLEWVKMQVE